jgi:hypothetical protein
VLNINIETFNETKYLQDKLFPLLFLLELGKEGGNDGEKSQT